MAEEPDGGDDDRPSDDERDSEHDEEPRDPSTPDPDDADDEGADAGTADGDGSEAGDDASGDDEVTEPDGDGVVSPADDPDAPTIESMTDDGGLYADDEGDGTEAADDEGDGTEAADDEGDGGTIGDGTAGEEQASDGGYADDAADDADPHGMYDDFEFEDEMIEPDTEYADPTPAGDEEWEGAPDDQEMPLADHIEEMVKRLGVVVVVMAVISGIAFPFGTDLINFLWYDYLPGVAAQCPGDATTIGAIADGGAACPRVYHPLAVILARLKVATLVGFVVALPIFVYETYLFMRPGLYPRERRYYLASVPTSLFLAIVGMLFAHLLVIPFLFDYFVSYSQNATVIAFGLTETFDLIVLLLGAFAIVFQIPLFVMLALMMGLVTREWLRTRRLIFWGVFAGLSFLFAPDPTGMAPIIVAATMIILFEGTLLLAKWTRRG
jgi:sec-independent protein translocase protein TatC